MIKVKICGLTNQEDYLLAHQLGADYCGFIFYEKSLRFIDKYSARNIVSKQNINSLKVGVFVNERINTVREIFEFVDLDIIQLHGDENPSYCRSLNLPYWKVIRVKDVSSIQKMNLYNCTVFLLDTYNRGIFGGTGLTFNPEITGEAQKKNKKIIVAGGVSIKNLEKIFKYQPFAIDVCSSLEKYPGKKSKKKMQFFFKKINQLRGQS
jgi:phosphoribosylanthranilate isomerase